MALKSDVLKQKIKYKGLWKYSDFYDFCFTWLKDNGYGVSEKEYVEKVESFGKEVNLDWEAKKGVTDYFKNVIGVKVRILGLNDAEAELEGRKIKTNKGEISIEVKAVLERDYEEKWENQPRWKFLRGIYDKYIMRTTTDEYEDRLKDDAKEFISQVKSFLQMGK